MAIKRYNLERLDYEIFEMEENEDGDYILFDDHLYVVKQFEKEISDLEDEINYLRNRYT